MPATVRLSSGRIGIIIGCAGAPSGSDIAAVARCAAAFEARCVLEVFSAMRAVDCIVCAGMDHAAASPTPEQRLHALEQLAPRRRWLLPLALLGIPVLLLLLFLLEDTLPPRIFAVALGVASVWGTLWTWTRERG